MPDLPGLNNINMRTTSFGPAGTEAGILAPRRGIPTR